MTLKKRLRKKSKGVKKKAEKSFFRPLKAFLARPRQKKRKGVNINFLTIVDHYVTNLVQTNKFNLEKKKVTFVTGSIFSM